MFYEISQDRHGLFSHKIKTKTTGAIRLPPYPIPHALRDVVKKEVEEMLEEGTIEPSKSDWSAPVVLVTKKDGSLRLCIDYRRLNSILHGDGRLSDALN